MLVKVLPCDFWYQLLKVIDTFFLSITKRLLNFNLSLSRHLFSQTKKTRQDFPFYCGIFIDF